MEDVALSLDPVEKPKKKPKITLIQDVVTRWTSELAMINSLLKHRESLDKFWLKYRGNRGMKLTLNEIFQRDEWPMLEDVKLVLEGPAMIVTTLQTTTYPSSSDSWLLILKNVFVLEKCVWRLEYEVKCEKEIQKPGNLRYHFLILNYLHSTPRSHRGPQEPLSL